MNNYVLKCSNKSGWFLITERWYRKYILVHPQKSQIKGTSSLKRIRKHSGLKLQIHMSQSICLKKYIQIYSNTFPPINQCQHFGGLVKLLYRNLGFI